MVVIPFCLCDKRRELQVAQRGRQRPGRRGRRSFTESYQKGGAIPGGIVGVAGLLESLFFLENSGDMLTDLCDGRSEALATW